MSGWPMAYLWGTALTALVSVGGATPRQAASAGSSADFQATKLIYLIAGACSFADTRTGFFSVPPWPEGGPMAFQETSRPLVPVLGWLRHLASWDEQLPRSQLCKCEACHTLAVLHKLNQ